MFRRNAAVNSDSEHSGPAKYQPDKANLVCDSKWLLHDIQRRIFVTCEIPKTHFAKAGTVTSGYLATNLEDDINGDGNSFSMFLDRVKCNVTNELNLTLQNSFARSA
jgi:hypothetical protein